MHLNIIIVLMSLGIFMRGLLYALAKYRGMANNKISFIQTDNPEEFLYVNKLASTAYMVIGSIVTMAILIANICYPVFFRLTFLYSLMGIFLIDYFVRVIVKIRISVDKQLKEWEEEDKLKEVKLKEKEYLDEHKKE